MNEKILIIEDNEDNLLLATKILEMAGYQVEGADSAEKGIAMASADRPDLIIMDLNLQGMDGLTAVRVIRDDEKLKDIRVVALTAFAMEGDREKALDAGCDGYMTKPINFRKFAQEIAEYLGKEVS